MMIEQLFNSNYIKKILLFFFVLSSQPFLISASDNYSIVFVHIGDQVPDHAEVAIEQARLMNPSCQIILIANQAAIHNQPINERLKCHEITYIACESLNPTRAHSKFIKTSKHNVHFRNGFWRYTSERFLYLDDLMTQYELENVFHLEYDNMLYVDLSEMLPVFIENYKGIAATFDNEDRCIPGFLFIRNQSSMSTLANYFADFAASRKNDMKVIGLFKRNNGQERIDYLPVIHKKYLTKHTLFGEQRFNLSNKYDFCKNIDQFDAIFDAAAIGQYLGGIDPRNGDSRPGFINESCLFDPSKIRFQWIRDKNGLWIPYAQYANELRKIVNLHIHSKKLAPFSSKVPQKQFVIIK